MSSQLRADLLLSSQRAAARIEQCELAENEADIRLSFSRLGINLNGPKKHKRIRRDPALKGVSFNGLRLALQGGK